MGIKDFFVKIPYLCDAKNAARWSRVNELVFNDELARPGAFARNDDDKHDAFNRMEVAFAFTGDEAKKEQCHALLRIAELSHYKAEHGALDEKEALWLDSLVVSAVEAEADFPEIAAIMTVDQALATSAWNI